MTTDVILPEFTASSDPKPGTWPKLKLQDFSTWYTPASFRSDAVESPQRYGNFDPGEMQLAAKNMSLNFIIESRSHEDLISTDLDTIMGIGGSKLPFPVRVRDDATDRYRTCMVDGLIDFEPFHPRKARVRIPLRADDPLRYSMDLQNPGTAVPNDSGVGLVFPLFSAQAGRRVVERKNVISDPNTSAVTTWVGASSTTSISAAGRLRLVATGASTAYVYPAPGADVTNGAGRFEVKPGDRVTMRASVTNPTSAPVYIRSGIATYTSTGAGSTDPNYVSSMVTLAAGATVVLEAEHVILTTTTTTTGILPLVYYYSTLAGAAATTANVIETTDWTVEVGDNAPIDTPYDHFTGDTVGRATPTTRAYSWTSTPNASSTVYVETSSSQAGVLDFGSLGSTGRAEVKNDGNETAWPQFLVTGPTGTSFSILNVEEGKVVEFSQPVYSGQQLLIDTNTGRATINGSGDVTRYLTRYEWSGIPPKGGTRSFQFDVVGGTGSATRLQVLARDTWR